MQYCPNCGAKTLPEARFCASCGSALEVRLGRAQGRIGGQTGAGALVDVEYMGFWIRFAALRMDVFALVVALIVLLVVVAYVPSLGILFIPVFFYGFYKHMKCQTLGRRLAGIKVVDESGEGISFWRGVLREVVGKPISDVVFPLGYLWVAFDAGKQGWHDKIATTYVVRRRDSLVSDEEASERW